MDKHLRGTISGFMMPNFVLDLPGGGGKRIVSMHDSYNEATGVSTWTAPGLPGKKGMQLYTYYDPLPRPRSSQVDVTTAEITGAVPQPQKINADATNTAISDACNSCGAAVAGLVNSLKGRRAPSRAWGA
jgi:hypothetical protein